MVSLVCSKSDTASPLKVRIRATSVVELLRGHTESDQLFNLAYGAPYGRLVEQSLGQSFNIMEVTSNTTKRCLAAIFPFNDSPNVCSRWAEQIEPYNLPLAMSLRSGQAVVMDFSAVAPQWRGRMALCFRRVARELVSDGFIFALTEVQWLRQLIFWCHVGWRILTPLCFNPMVRCHDVKHALQRNQSPEELLGPGETFIWHQEPYYKDPQWNVVLPMPVFLAYNLVEKANKVHGDDPES